MSLSSQCLVYMSLVPPNNPRPGFLDIGYVSIEVPQNNLSLWWTNHMLFLKIKIVYKRYYISIKK